MTDLLVGDDGVLRCAWPGADPLYLDYHDQEWGRGEADDHRLFEKIVLEGFQAGLAWITILRKRERFREVFAAFDPARVAAFGPDDVEVLLGDAGIIRHRGKIAQAEKEKVILAVGNVAGVAKVEEDITTDEASSEPVFHTVQTGDTLWAIATEYLGDGSRYNEIFEANRPMLSDPDKIYPGQMLRIPQK